MHMIHIHPGFALETCSEQEKYVDHGHDSTQECLFLLGLPCNHATVGQSQIGQHTSNSSPWVLLSVGHYTCFQLVPKTDLLHCSSSLSLIQQNLR